MSEDSYQHHCGHEQEIMFLQQKLSQVHTKLIQQIEITKQKELETIALKKIQYNPSNDTNKHFESASSEASKNQKIWLLEENLEAMRKKVMQQIKQKKQMKKKMIQQTIKYENDLKQAKQQFEGLQILYLKLLESTNHPEKKIGQLTGTDRSGIQSIKTVEKRQTELRFHQKENQTIVENNNKFNKKKLKIELKNQQSPSSNSEDGEGVLRQLQEVKNAFRRQKELKVPNSTKQKIQNQVTKAKFRNNQN